MEKPNVVVMIPAFNEERHIGKVVSTIPRDIGGNVKVLVIDDGSKDKTVKMAKEAGADKVVSHRTNRGLGIAFKTGILNALKMNADIIVTMDADGQFNPKDIKRLIKPILREKADMVTCTRFLDPNTRVGMPFVKFIGNKMFTIFVNWLTKGNYTDTQCGFRAYSKEAALRLTTFGKFTYTQEVFLDLIEKGMTVVEVPCKVRPQRKGGKSKIVKNPISYGLKALRIILRAQRDYHPMKFFGFFSGIFFIIGFAISAMLIFQPYGSRFFTPNWPLGLFIGSLFFLTIGVLAEKDDRQRKIMEDILYEMRKKDL